MRRKVICAVKKKKMRTRVQGIHPSRTNTPLPNRLHSSFSTLPSKRNMSTFIPFPFPHCISELWAPSYLGLRGARGGGGNFWTNGVWLAKTLGSPSSESLMSREGLHQTPYSILEHGVNSFLSLYHWLILISNSSGVNVSQWTLVSLHCQVPDQLWIIQITTKITILLTKKKCCFLGLPLEFQFPSCSTMKKHLGESLQIVVALLVTITHE